MKRNFIWILVSLTTIMAAQPTKTAQSIYFDIDKSDITSRNSRILDSLVSVYNKTEISKIEVQGFTDETGSIAYNHNLSQKRANAVFLYLKNKGIDQSQLSVAGLGINTELSEDLLQRNVTVLLYSSSTEKPITEIELGTSNDTLSLDGDYFKNIQSYSDTESMIHHNMYALDEEENIIVTSGMITFEPNDAFDKAGFQNSNKVIKVCLEIPEGKKYDPGMKVWLITKGKDGQNLWKESDLPIEYNKGSNQYCSYVKCDLINGICGINYDRKPIIDSVDYGTRRERELLASVATFRDFNFYDVELTRSSFSAIKNKKDIKWHTFVAKSSEEIPSYVFKGKFKENGTEHVLHFELSKAEFTGSLYREARFYLNKKSNYFIDEREYNKRGFWPWIKRLFVKET